MKLILSSCDFGNPESARTIYDNLGMPISGCRVLYFPNENATEKKIKSGKYEKRLLSFGFSEGNIHVFNYHAPENFCDISVDAVYISGGNTFGTLKRIRESGADVLIEHLVKHGAVYIGGSAGAHIATKSISHVAKYDTDTFGLTDFSGLGFYNGILICHYTDQREKDFELLKNTSEHHVKALSDEESLIFNT